MSSGLGLEIRVTSGETRSWERVIVGKVKVGQDEPSGVKRCRTAYRVYYCSNNTVGTATFIASLCHGLAAENSSQDT